MWSIFTLIMQVLVIEFIDGDGQIGIASLGL